MIINILKIHPIGMATFKKAFKILVTFFACVCEYLHTWKGKAEDSGLKGPGVNPRSRQEEYKNILSCFWLFTLEL